MIYGSWRKMKKLCLCEVFLFLLSIHLQHTITSIVLWNWAYVIFCLPHKTTYLTVISLFSSSEKSCNNVKIELNASKRHQMNWIYLKLLRRYYIRLKYFPPLAFLFKNTRKLVIHTSYSFRACSLLSKKPLNSSMTVLYTQKDQPPYSWPLGINWTKDKYWLKAMCWVMTRCLFVFCSQCPKSSRAAPNSSRNTAWWMASTASLGLPQISRNYGRYSLAQGLSPVFIRMGSHCFHRNYFCHHSSPLLVTNYI